MLMSSPFLTPVPTTTEGNLAILHLRRDNSIPAILTTSSTKANKPTGYAEGVVTNTRFGSFPHSTLVNQPWGTQIRASVVDTGSRGRNGIAGGKKRKRAVDSGQEDDDDGTLKEAVAASSGFLHILPPTPENWTRSLPHRTQVVYTPDYSYILHRIKARPGSVLIEAGSGSGSFTHAAARSVFNGYPGQKLESKLEEAQEGPSSEYPPTDKLPEARAEKQNGHVFSYEYHEERHRKVKEEMIEHGLSSLVTTTHRDVYNEGFLLNNSESTPADDRGPWTSPSANAIFLDLPAPWLALPHLTRQPTALSPSPLDPDRTVHICTFIPCIEQAQQTISALRRHGWIDIEMVEMSQKRIDIRREYTGLEYEGMRGSNGVPYTIEAAVERLKEVEERARLWRGKTQDGDDENEELSKARERLRLPTEAERREMLKDKEKTIYKQGRLVHRTEPDLKTHTSYLVFAILPREWSDEDERRMREKWGVVSASGGADALQGKKNKKQLKREAKLRGKERKENQQQDIKAEDLKEEARDEPDQDLVAMEADDESDAAGGGGGGGGGEDLVE